jgi:hypothetical protein
MHENSQIPVNGLSRSQPKGDADHLPAASTGQNAPGNPGKGATFDDSYNFSAMRKLQDASKFDKARFSFRLYKR